MFTMGGQKLGIANLNPSVVQIQLILIRVGARANDCTTASRVQFFISCLWQVSQRFKKKKNTFEIPIKMGTFCGKKWTPELNIYHIFMLMINRHWTLCPQVNWHSVFKLFLSLPKSTKVWTPIKLAYEFISNVAFVRRVAWPGPIISQFG